tara:strand:+ start:109 stop:447 length:339 start_codon:yes stop_codon:yes gene_type:complete
MLTVVAPIALPTIRMSVGDVTVTSAISGFATEIVDAGLSSSIIYDLLMATRTSMEAAVLGSAIKTVIEYRTKDFIKNLNLAMGFTFFLTSDDPFYQNIYHTQKSNIFKNQEA